MTQAVQDYSISTNISLHKDLRFNQNLSDAEKLFLAEIKSMKMIEFSSRKLGKLFGVTHNTVLNWVKRLVDLDLLEVVLDVKKNGYKRFLKPK